MIKKLQSITNRLHSSALLVLLLVSWQLVSMSGLIPAFMLPSPVRVVTAFAEDFSTMMQGAGITLWEAFSGLSIGVAGGFALAVLMDNNDFLYRSVYPILVLTQTIPTIAIAPLLVLWMGYGAAPKITLVFIVCFFPVTIGMLDGFRGVDPDAVALLRSMGANSPQIYRHIKFPSALPRFFSGLKIASTYAVVGAVIAEWLGGTSGLGVYMTRVRKSYSFDRMFAVIFLVSGLSILLIKLVDFAQKKAMPYAYLKD